jgi:glutamate 5-kinase
VLIRGPDGLDVGRGLIGYDAEDARRIVGRSTEDILLILGAGARAEMIHRDDLALVG